jgi:hypothetical protein
MSTTITVNTDLIGQDFIDQIKKLFPNKKVEITIAEADAQDYIDSNKLYKADLLNRIKDYEKKKNIISIKANDIL